MPAERIGAGISQRLTRPQMETSMADSSGSQVCCTIGYMDLAATVTAPTEVIECCRTAMAPFFETADRSGGVDSFVDISVMPTAFDGCPENPGATVRVDSSRYAHLTSDGMVWNLDAERWLARIDSTGSWFRFDSAKKKIEMFQPDSDRSLIDLQRLLKNLFTTALEQADYVQLHSSGVVMGEQGILILGDMWQGKTTLLMELLSGFDTRQLSCDTIVIGHRANGVLEARGWPSPFSISHGTMADHPELYRHFPAERKTVDYSMLWKENRKAVLASEEVCALFNTTVEPKCVDVALVLLSRFNRNGPIGVEPVSDAKELQNFMRTVYLGSRDPIYHNWHGYHRIDDATIERNIATAAQALFDRADVVTMTWAPSAESLMKSIPLLGRRHNDLGRLTGGS